MVDQTSAPKTAKTKPNREERLKAALKQNMARRKAQARARDDVKSAEQNEINKSVKDAT